MNNGSVLVFQTSARRNFAYVVKQHFTTKTIIFSFEVRKRNTSNPDCDLVMRIESAYVFDEGKSLEYTGKIRFFNSFAKNLFRRENPMPNDKSHSLNVAFA